MRFSLLGNSGLDKIRERGIQEQEVRVETQKLPLHCLAPDSERHYMGDDSARSAGEWLDAIIALASLVLASPLILFAVILTKLADGGPVLWCGERLGKDRRPFAMYKIRSLAPGAEALTGGRLVTPPMAAKLNLEHRYGRFLRDSRLDELPQFLNVLKGDMRLFGPRPIRRKVYEAECRNIPGYDRRFTVKPGLFGYSQVLTPHSSDKRIRKKLDNHFITTEPSLLRRLLFLASVMLVLVSRLPIEFIQSMRQSNGKENRKLYRVIQSRCRVQFVNDPSAAGIVTDLSDSAMSVLWTKEIAPSDSLLRLEVRHFQWSRLKGRRKIIYCRILSSEGRPANSMGYPFACVFRYEPLSPLNHYLIQKYLLRRSLL